MLYKYEILLLHIEIRPLIFVQALQGRFGVAPHLVKQSIPILCILMSVPVLLCEKSFLFENLRSEFSLRFYPCLLLGSQNSLVSAFLV